jgi:hypothetical protein
MLVAFSLVSLWKDDRFGYQLTGIIWFSSAIYRLLRRDRPSRWIRSESQIVGKGLFILFKVESEAHLASAFS